MTGPPPTVLLVDDEPEIRRLFPRLLGDEYEVETAASGAEALVRVEARPFDVIVSDQRMPGMTGIEFLARARTLCPEAIRIVLTAYSETEAMLGAINRGEVYRFVIKPWEPADMRITIRQAIERLELQRDRQRLLDEVRRQNESLERSLRELAEARDRLVRAEKLAIVGRLASGVTHDIRNYLVPMLNISLAARRHADDVLLQKVAAAVEDGAREVMDLLRELSALAKDRPVEYSLAPGDLGAVAREAVVFVQSASAGEGRRIEAEVGPAPLAFVAAGKVRRVLINLIQNAAQAGARTIRVRVGEVGGRPWAAVADDGPGIPPDVLPHIWEPFFSTRSGAGGVGLGLDICRVIMKGHSGRIWCESEVGRGATFHLEFQAAP